LVEPKYPPAAHYANVYGQVQVEVTIDENGHVLSAVVMTGHPLLRAASIAAASNSSFEPFTVNGEQFRVSGTIFYNYLPNQWNWLEIGYTLKHGSSYYSIKDLVSLLPVGFSDESRFLQQIVEGNADWDKAIESIIATVRGKLSNDRRSTWLFETGSTIAEIRDKCCRFDNVNHELSANLNALIISAPDDISSDLLSGLRQLADLIENRGQDTYSPVDGSRSYKLLDNIERQFPFIGR
ncbi:MAG: TonB family protein, partial [Pyrinomonadaceae bacterium]